VNPTEEAATLRIKGDWNGVAKTVFEYYAPGSLIVANSMDNKQAVALKRLSPTTDGCDVILAVPALSAGVLTINVRSQQ
jgi:alpha-N-arabinofuranosidase